MGVRVRQGKLEFIMQLHVLVLLKNEFCDMFRELHANENFM